MQSQTQELDSLKTALANHTVQDTTRANLLYSMAYYNFQRDSEQANLYLNKAASLSDSLNYALGQAKVFYLKGVFENIKSNIPQSLSYFEQALEKYKSINDIKGMGVINIAFGITHYDLSEYDKAIERYKKAQKIYEELGDEREQITCLINIGNAYSEKGEYTKTIDYYKRALKRSKASGDADGVSSVQFNLGVVYKIQGNYPLAIANYNKALQYNLATQDTLAMAKCYNNLGDIYTLMENYDRALGHLKKSLKYAQQKGNTRLVASTQSIIGGIYLKKNDPESALNYYKTSLELSENTNDLRQLAVCYNSIGKAKLMSRYPKEARKAFEKANEISSEIQNKQLLAESYLGIAESLLWENQFHKAVTPLNLGSEIADELEMLAMRKKVAGLRYTIFQGNRDYKKALESHIQYKKLNDSLFNKENVEKIAQLEYEYKYKQAMDSANIRELKLTKTVLTTSQDLEKSRQRYLWAVIGILLVTSVLGGAFFFQKYQNIKAKNQTILTEQKLLRSQMTPHFMFNSLSVLQGMILNQENGKSLTYLSKFSKLLRSTLEGSRQKLVALSDELATIDGYMELCNLDTNPPYQYTLQVDPDVDPRSLKIPPMLIQPFVENSVEHAFTAYEPNKRIEVGIQCKNQQLCCTITDNGKGISENRSKTKKGKNSLATTISTERLQKLAKEFGMPGSITIQNRAVFGEKGTLVTLIIPYKIHVDS
ncbi:tetratricopeptide repeat-containing sensor histidine kinase [Sediminicola luteus]|uniref:tetratricopeptide repeat-containing sensor histidine kinase n=1 Tax=Sediminicola luteus TaxID=319238 RepID=UPI00155824B5|nr:tetratricopeptide repeat protein [Sediminicola luteus]